MEIKNTMRVLIACEFSGRVRDAFRSLGHDAWSCDLLPTEAPGPHIQGDVLDHLNDGWDLMICHPPCKYLSDSGVGWLFKNPREGKANQAVGFFLKLYNSNVPRVCLSSSKSRWINNNFRLPDQIVRPWFWGKTAHLWLKNLPKLDFYLDVLSIESASSRTKAATVVAKQWMGGINNEGLQKDSRKIKTFSARA